MGDRKLKPGWTRVAFGEMATCVNDRIDDPAAAGVERYVGLEHLDSDSLTIRRWGTPADVSATKLLFRAGDIIFGRRRAYQRKLGVPDFDGICSAHALVLRAKPDVVLPQFLPFFMQSDLFMERAMNISVGSLSPTINWKTLAKQEFTLPPPAEQRRISAVLTAHGEVAARHLESAALAFEVADALMSRCFGTLRSDSRVYDPAFGFYTSKLSLVPLGDLMTEVHYGTSVPTVNGGQHALLRMTNLSEGLTTDSDLAFVNLSEREYGRYLLRHDDVLVNRTNSHDLVGRTGIHKLSGSYVFASYLIRIRTDERRLVPGFLCAFLNHPLGRRQVLRFATRGVSQSNINVDSLRRILVPSTELKHQRVLIDALEMLRNARIAHRRRAQGVRSFVSAFLLSQR